MGMSVKECDHVVALDQRPKGGQVFLGPVEVRTEWMEMKGQDDRSARGSDRFLEVFLEELEARAGSVMMILSALVARTREHAEVH